MQERQRFLMGVGLDSDGHARVTKAEDYLLLGGSERTHRCMRDHIERFTEALRCMGTDLHNASSEEMLEAAEVSGLID